MSDTTPKIDLSNLKAGGFIKERGKDFFTVRLRVTGGRLKISRLKKLLKWPRNSVVNLSIFPPGNQLSCSTSTSGTLTMWWQSWEKRIKR